MKLRWTFVMVVAIASVVTFGCGGESHDSGKGQTIKDIKAAGGELAESLEGLTTLLTEKEGELATIKEKLSGMSATDLMSDEGKSLEAASAALLEEIASIKGKIKSFAG